MEIAIGCEFRYEVAAQTHAIVMVEPHPSAADRITRARFSTTPEVDSSVYTDFFGNRCRRLTMPPGPLMLTYEGTAATTGEVDPADEAAPELLPSEVPDEALVYLLPSRYCQSDQLAPMAIGHFGHLPRGWTRVNAISQWVHERVAFQYGSSSATTSSLEIVTAGVGVCRDFAHLSISLCRALNIPARYVFGYLPDIDVPVNPDPMDFCAWIEVYLGDRWWTFDPRNHARRIGRTVIGHGRDAADVAMLSTFGPATLVAMSVRAEQLPPSQVPAP